MYPIPATLVYESAEDIARLKRKNRWADVLTRRRDISGEFDCLILFADVINLITTGRPEEDALLHADIAVGQLRLLLGRVGRRFSLVR